MQTGHRWLAQPCSGCVHRGSCKRVHWENQFRAIPLPECINLAEVTVSEFPSPRSESNGLTLQDRTREPAPGCLSSTGIHTLALPKHFVAIGAHACDSCRLLESVEEIPEFTFGHCTSLREVFLPTTLHTIRVKAFMSLLSLLEVGLSWTALPFGGWSKCPEHADGVGFMQKKMLSPSVRP